jgi:hypothetical protein
MLQNDARLANLGLFWQLGGTCFMDTSPPFKWRHFEAEIICSVRAGTYCLSCQISFLEASYLFT